MKSIILKLFVVLALMSTSLQASIESDMADPNLTLEQIVNNALASDSGMSIAEILQKMIDADPSLSNAIIATGFIMKPDDYEAITRVAFNNGITPEDVVVMALAATDADMEEQVVNFIKQEAPGSDEAIDMAVAAMEAPEEGGTENEGGGSVSEEVAVVLKLLTDLDDGIGSPAGGPPT
jgi:hypothetical protein